MNFQKSSKGGRGIFNPNFYIAYIWPINRAFWAWKWKWKKNNLQFWYSENEERGKGVGGVQRPFHPVHHPKFCSETHKVIFQLRSNHITLYIYACNYLSSVKQFELYKQYKLSKLHNQLIARFFSSASLNQLTYTKSEQQNKKKRLWRGAPADLFDAIRIE